MTSLRARVKELKGTPGDDTPLGHAIRQATAEPDAHCAAGFNNYI